MAKDSGTTRTIASGSSSGSSISDNSKKELATRDSQLRDSLLKKTNEILGQSSLAKDEMKSVIDSVKNLILTKNNLSKLDTVEKVRGEYDRVDKMLSDFNSNSGKELSNLKSGINNAFAAGNREEYNKYQSASDIANRAINYVRSEINQRLVSLDEHRFKLQEGKLS